MGLNRGDVGEMLSDLGVVLGLLLLALVGSVVAMALVLTIGALLL